MANVANEKPCNRQMFHGRIQCRCELCAVCGYRRHDAVHMPHFGAPKDAPAYNHEFVPKGEHNE